MTDGLDYSYEYDDISTLPDAYDFASDARTARLRRIAWRILRANTELATERDALRAELARVQAQLAALDTTELADAWPSIPDLDGEDVFLGTLGPPTGEE